MGLILDSSLFIADEREIFDVVAWLRSRPPEPVAISAISLSELWFGIEADESIVRARRRQRWLKRIVQRLEVVPLDSRIARIHARTWARLSGTGTMIGPHDLIIAATAIHRRWAVATFNTFEFDRVPGLDVIVP